MCNCQNRDLKIYDVAVRRRGFITKDTFIEDISYEKFVVPGVFSNAWPCIKALSHGAIFLATCNAILHLGDVKLANTSFHYSLLIYF